MSVSEMWDGFKSGLKMFVREGLVGEENYDILTDGEFTSGDIGALAEGGVFLALRTEGKFFMREAKLVEEAGQLSRNGALNQAKRDAGIPRSQQPEAVNRVDMRLAQHEGGHVIKDSNGKVISTREYVCTNKDGKKIVIQDHSAGHQKGGQGPHFNVRPADNTRTGKVPGTMEHYPFNK
ncbi:HNH/endonuclease VII fold putative polymorphic toxin [Paenibacillus oryzisoli]|nr:HNH/endonuclease VII fold putative polymorphic toxin [Paenibacillus oryzisoli]